ncbi:MAG: hypothetical protein WEC75_03075 [Dehalococcoidia bacterium]
MTTSQPQTALTIDPAELGTLELGDLWVPYADLYDAPFMPTRITVGADEYAFHSSIIEKGHGALLPGRVRELREQGKRPLIIERGDRYYVFVTPP